MEPLQPAGVGRPTTAIVPLGGVENNDVNGGIDGSVDNENDRNDDEDVMSVEDIIEDSDDIEKGAESNDAVVDEPTRCPPICESATENVMIGMRMTAESVYTSPLTWVIAWGIGRIRRVQRMRKISIARAMYDFVVEL